MSKIAAEVEAIHLDARPGANLAFNQGSRYFDINDGNLAVVVSEGTFVKSQIKEESIEIGRMVGMLEVTRTMVEEVSFVSAFDDLLPELFSNIRELHSHCHTVDRDPGGHLDTLMKQSENELLKQVGDYLRRVGRRKEAKRKFQIVLCKNERHVADFSKTNLPHTIEFLSDGEWSDVTFVEYEKGA